MSLLALILATPGMQALYDPSDLTSLYQSRTGGSTGAVDSVVGIMLDKSEMSGKTAAAFIAGQSELWTDPTPTIVDSGGSTGAYNQSTNTMSNGAGGTSGYPRFQFGLGLTIGSWYWVSGRIDGDRSAFNLVRVAGSGSTASLSYNATTGIFFGVLKAEAAYIEILTVGTTTYTNAVLAEISVKSLPGYHALAPSDAARPILRSASSKNYLDADGTDDWMQVFPTLDLTAAWWHVGGWTIEATGKYAFCLSNSAASAAYRRNGTAAEWLNSGSTFSSPHGGDPTSTHVLTLEHSGFAGTLAGRYNGANAGSLTPYNYTAETKGLAFFSRGNAAYSLGLDGRFYGGAFGTGALSSADRALLERYVASLTGVSL